MPWSTIATNQCVSLNNLRDAIANGIFVAISSVPSGTKQITKTEALAYVDIQTSPLSSKASNQLVVKNNLSAKVYTYQRYDLSPTTCSTNNPIPFWSYLNIPYGSYNLNGTGSLYQIIPSTHTTFTNQITSYVSVICTPVTIYTYVTYNVNTSTCALSNSQQWWSYNNYSNGYYYINGPGTLYLLEGSSHTNYSNQITSVEGSVCTGSTLYYYNLYSINPCNCQQYLTSVVRSNTYYPNGFYYADVGFGYIRYYISSTTPQNYYPAFSVQGTAPTCVPNYCKIWYFNNSGDLGEPAETWSYVPCGGGGVSTVTISVGQPSQSRCVAEDTVPFVGSQGDNPYTFDETCC
jgi:hypothetical protein